MLEMGNRIRVDDLARKMIRMRGLRPDIDIQITYTGIRPGEKLHEDLVRPEDDITHTNHPLIYRVIPRASHGLGDLASEVERLVALAEQGRRDELVTELMRISGERLVGHQANGDAAMLNAAEIVES